LHLCLFAVVVGLLASILRVLGVLTELGEIPDLGLSVPDWLSVGVFGLYLLVVILGRALCRGLPDVSQMNGLFTTGMVAGLATLAAVLVLFWVQWNVKDSNAALVPDVARWQWELVAVVVIGFWVGEICVLVALSRLGQATEAGLLFHGAMALAFVYGLLGLATVGVSLFGMKGGRGPASEQMILGLEIGMGVGVALTLFHGFLFLWASATVAEHYLKRPGAPRSRW
jgi:hypothetical protein